MKYARIKSHRVLALASLLSLAACASAPDEAHPWADFWRVGYVDHEVAFGDATPLVRAAQDCRAILPSTKMTGIRWVMLHYRRPPEEIFRVVPIQSDQHFTTSQALYVKVDDCTQVPAP